MRMPTVLIKRAGVDGPVHVNQEDYDANPSAFELWDGPAPVDTPPPAPTKPAAPVQYLVTKLGKLYMVVDMSGTAVDIPGIDAGGYHNENDAWAAIAALANQG